MRSLPAILDKLSALNQSHSVGHIRLQEFTHETGTAILTLSTSSSKVAPLNKECIEKK